MSFYYRRIPVTPSVLPILTSLLSLKIQFALCSLSQSINIHQSSLYHLFIYLSVTYLKRRLETAYQKCTTEILLER